MIRFCIPFLCATVLSACAILSKAPVTPVSDLAPSGKLRAAINFGNPVLANRDPATGAPRGVSVDLATELARRLGVPVEFVTYDAAGRVFEGAKAGAWDIAFLAVDPVRANEIEFTAAYVVIEGAYLVRQASSIRSNAEVDRSGIRVVAARGSAYDLYLSRELKLAKIVHAPTSRAVTDTFIAGNLDVAAGVRQQLEADARRLPGVRLLDGRFMVINQAMGTLKGRPTGARYLREYVEEMKSSGFVGQALARHRIEGAAVAPPAPAGRHP